MASIFSKIIAREIPAYILAETENCIAILDAFPIQKGHTLVIPKKEVNHFLELDTALYTELMAFVQQVGLAVQKAVPCERVCLAVVGFEVPHVHVHLIPANAIKDTEFSNPKLKLSTEEMETIALEIRKFL